MENGRWKMEKGQTIAPWMPSVWLWHPRSRSRAQSRDPLPDGGGACRSILKTEAARSVIPFNGLASRQLVFDARMCSAARHETDPAMAGRRLAFPEPHFGKEVEMAATPAGVWLFRGSKSVVSLRSTHRLQALMPSASPILVS